MAPPTSSASLSLSLPLPLPVRITYFLARLPPVSLSVLRRRRVVLAAPARPRAALLPSLSDSREENEEYDEEEEEEDEDEERVEGQEYEGDEEAVEFVEVGYVSGVHGVRGDVLVTPRTDFPELRFGTPGKRWLRARAAGKQQVNEFEIVRGRAHTGKKGWIVSFDGVDDLDQARQIVGSAILVEAGDRPQIEDDEFYSLDLVGMRVIVKETGKLAGTVAQVFNFGGGDLLQVMIGSDADTAIEQNLEHQDSTSSREHVWIPFAQDIVPDVDMEKREMWITPPKGLLELNSRSDKRSKKERRAMEWKDRKRLQRHVIAAKKVLSDMDQGHVLEGLLSGNKVQKASLGEQIGRIDFQLFRHAVQYVSKQIESSSKKSLANSLLSRKKAMKIPYKTLNIHDEKVEHVFSSELKKGIEILLKSKAAIVLVRNGSDSDAKFLTLLNIFSELMKAVENRVCPPFIIVSPAGHVEGVRSCLMEDDYFGLDAQKLWVLEELNLPIVSISEVNREKILMKSRWEIIERPAGSGGVFSLLSSNKILESFNEMGVQYTQICSVSNSPTIGHPLLFGAVASRGADVGIKLPTNEMEGDFNLILSIDQLNKMCRDVTQLRFSALPEQHEHVELVDGQWVTVQPEAVNSHLLHADVTSVLNSCSADKLCVMEIVEQ